jgi:hypothetical protein
VRTQLLRLRLYGSALGVAELDGKQAMREAARIRAHQYRARDVRVRGGFGFGKRDSHRLPFVNPATTVFALQALEQWRLFRKGAFAADYRELI